MQYRFKQEFSFHFEVYFDNHKKYNKMYVILIIY